MSGNGAHAGVLLSTMSTNLGAGGVHSITAAVSLSGSADATADVNKTAQLHVRSSLAQRSAEVVVGGKVIALPSLHEDGKVIRVSFSKDHPDRAFKVATIEVSDFGLVSLSTISVPRLSTTCPSSGI